jgi:hypothetical protein
MMKANQYCMACGGSGYLMTSNNPDSEKPCPYCNLYSVEYYNNIFVEYDCTKFKPMTEKRIAALHYQSNPVILECLAEIERLRKIIKCYEA